MKQVPWRTVVLIITALYFLSIVFAQTAAGEPNPGGNISNSLVPPVIGSEDIRVVLDHIFISNKNNSLEVSEIVVFRNEGQEIQYSKDNHTYFAVSTPKGVKNLKTQVMECCLVEEEGMVYMDPMQQIKPGDNFQMQITYSLKPGDKEYMFNKSAVYNTTSLSVFVDKKLGAEGSYEIKLGGNDYNVIAFNDLKSGETVVIPIKIIEKAIYFYAAAGIFIICSLGLGYHFRKKIFRKRKNECTLEELELEKKKIFQAIYGFEKHTGTENSEEFRKLMEEYRQKAVQIFIKIDKIKNG